MRLHCSCLLVFVLGLGGSSAVAQELPGSAPPDLGPDLSRFLPKEDLERDGRRTLGSFPKNLGRSFIGVFSKESLNPFLVGAGFAGSAFLVDSHAQSALQGRAPEISHAASSAGGLKYMVPATLGLFAAGRFAEGSRFRAFSYDATQAVIVNAVYTDVLKRITTRPRPDGSNNLSFPSGHTSTAFAWATVAQAHYGWKAGIPSYLAATTIGLSRVTNDKHHLSDVLAGATIGYITGRTVVRTNGEPVGRHKTVTLHPMTDAQGTGVGVGASLSW